MQCAPSGCIRQRDPCALWRTQVVAVATLPLQTYRIRSGSSIMSAPSAPPPVLPFLPFGLVAPLPLGVFGLFERPITAGEPQGAWLHLTVASSLSRSYMNCELDGCAPTNIQRRHLPQKVDGVDQDVLNVNAWLSRQQHRSHPVSRVSVSRVLPLLPVSVHDCVRLR